MYSKHKIHICSCILRLFDLSHLVDDYCPISWYNQKHMFEPYFGTGVRGRNPKNLFRLIPNDLWVQMNRK